jgi:hypothetical protein
MRENYHPNLLEIPKASITPGEAKTAGMPPRPVASPCTPPTLTAPILPASVPTTKPTDSDADMRVYVRIRPLLAAEDQATFDGRDNQIIVHPPRAQSVKHFAERRFTFTAILREDSTQSEVSDTVAMPLLRRVMHGVDALLFAGTLD